MRGKNKNIKRIFNRVFQILFASISIGYVYYALFYKNNFEIKNEAGEVIAASIGDWFVYLKNTLFVSSTSYFILIGIVCLMFVNWGIEVLKWKLSINKITPVSYKLATIAILSGVAASLFTPYRIGGYFGKMFQLPFKARVRAGIITIVVNYSQFLSTLLIGSICLLGLFYSSSYSNDFGGEFFLIGSSLIILVVALLFMVLYVNIHWLTYFFKKIKALAKWERYWNVIALISKNGVTPRVLALSNMRYCIIIFQYLLGFYLFELNMEFWLMFLLTSAMFYVHQYLPTINFMEFGLTKAAVFIALFESFEIFGDLPPNSTFIITCVCFVIWLINIIIPAIMGSFMLLRIKVLREK